MVNSELPGNSYGQEDEGLSIEIPRTERFIRSASAVSDFLKNLDLPAAMNDSLIALLIEHVHAAEEGGFRFGLKLGLEYGRSEQEGL